MNSASSMDQVLLEKLTKILEVNYSKENFGVKNLAEGAGLSRSKLHRKLRKIKGLSASKFICEFRLKKAFNLLKNNVATVSEISYRVGFSSPQYFSKCFHQYYGFTPGNTKNRIQNQIENHNSFTPNKKRKIRIPSEFKLHPYKIYTLSNQFKWRILMSAIILFLLGFFLFLFFFS